MCFNTPCERSRSLRAANAYSAPIAVIRPASLQLLQSALKPTSAGSRKRSEWVWRFVMLIPLVHRITLDQAAVLRAQGGLSASSGRQRAQQSPLPMLTTHPEKGRVDHRHSGNLHSRRNRPQLRQHASFGRRRESLLPGPPADAAGRPNRHPHERPSSIRPRARRALTGLFWSRGFSACSSL